MKLKTYRAGTMGDALLAVKKDLGKDAVILHTRSYKVGGWFGYFGKQMVEITASADVNAVHPRRQRAAMAGESDSDLTTGESTNGAGGLVAKTYGAPRSVRVSAENAARSQAIADRAQIGAEAAVAHAAAPVARMAIAAGSRASVGVASEPTADETVRAELVAIRRMVGQVLQTSARAGAATAPACLMPEALLRHYTKLIENEVARELADELVATVRDELTPAEMADEGIVRTSVLRHLESLLPAAENVARPAKSADGRPLTVALVGPTGVGKTTTIAKLAAAYKLRHGKRVALITSDTYRIAAVDQLRTYANIIGVPLKVVMSPEDMAAACAALADADVVLIDTAGRSPGDAVRVDELAAFVRAARPHQTHLVLAGVASEPAMVRTIDRFSALKPDHVIFTKLDEAASFGVLVNVASRIDAKLSYITTGQEVPDDIEPTRSDRLARMVLDGAPRP